MKIMSILRDRVRVHAHYIRIKTFYLYQETLSVAEFEGDRLLYAAERVEISLKGSPAARVENSCCQFLLAKLTVATVSLK